MQNTIQKNNKLPFYMVITYLIFTCSIMLRMAWFFLNELLPTMSINELLGYLYRVGWLLLTVSGGGILFLSLIQFLIIKFVKNKKYLNCFVPVILLEIVKIGFGALFYCLFNYMGISFTSIETAIYSCLTVLVVGSFMALFLADIAYIASIMRNNALRVRIEEKQQAAIEQSAATRKVAKYKKAISGMHNFFVIIYTMCLLMIPFSGGIGIGLGAFWVIALLVLPEGIFLCTVAIQKRLLDKKDNITLSNYHIPLILLEIIKIVGTFIGIVLVLVAWTYVSGQIGLLILLVTLLFFVILLILDVALLRAKLKEIKANTK